MEGVRIRNKRYGASWAQRTPISTSRHNGPSLARNADRRLDRDFFHWPTPSGEPIVNSHAGTNTIRAPSIPVIRSTISGRVCHLLSNSGVKTPGHGLHGCWHNGSNESFNGTFRRECLDAELFHSLSEARVVLEDWRRLYNHERPHSALGYQVPAAVFMGAITRKT